MIDFNLQNFKVDKTMISKLQELDPYAILGQLGLSKKNTSEILKGDFSSVKQQEPFVIDLEVFIKNYGKLFNPNLIIYFLQKAKEDEFLSEEEMDIYKEAHDNFFKLIFKVGIEGRFILNSIEDECLLLKYNKDYFILMKNEMNNIFFLKETSNKSK
jgi:hypothetical protein